MRAGLIPVDQPNGKVNRSDRLMQPVLAKHAFSCRPEKG